ncbi:MAG TPA: hypothetical protein VHO90_22525 [Bacteroidales bacterium]|nr:hypothetical protein [Bacteroidales bacterium]
MSNDKPFTVYVEKQSPEDKITFDTLKMYHGECYGGIIHKYCPEGNTLLSCSRCNDQANLYYVDQLRYFIRTAIDGKSLKFSVDGVLFEIHQKESHGKCYGNKLNEKRIFSIEVEHFISSPKLAILDRLRMRHINCSKRGSIRVINKDSSTILQCKRCNESVAITNEVHKNKIIKTSIDSSPDFFLINNNVSFYVYPAKELSFEEMEVSYVP